MDAPPTDLDVTRAAIAARDLTQDASAFITHEVAIHLPFERLGAFKTLLKRYFSTEPWDATHGDELNAIVTSAVDRGWWEHHLDGAIQLVHGIRDGRYVLWVSGATSAGPSIFDRVFEGPVVPEPTPHRRKVKFTVGGDAGPGVWYRRTDGTPDDDRVQRLLEEPDVTDVMVAADFVTVGLERSSSWENRLDDILGLIESLYSGSGPTAPPARTREELLREAGRIHLDVRRAELHLLDPDDDADRARLVQALDADDVKLRRIAVAILAESNEASIRHDAVRRGFADEARTVRRTAIDAASDAEDPALRSLFEAALDSDDSWVRWKAVRAIGEIGVDASRDMVARLENDADFQVRFEVARALRG